MNDGQQEFRRVEIDLGWGRTRIKYIPVDRTYVDKRSRNVPAPMVIKSFSDPVQSMADGKWYDNPADLRKSYKAENNPAGVDYIELGNEDIKFEDHTQSRAELRDEIKQAIAMVDQGWSPESVPLDDI